MCLVFQLIVFLSIILFESIVGNIVTVGNYSDLNPDGCGLSRHSMGVNTTCMKWHKDILSPMRGANRVGLGDAPWTALLTFSKWVNGSEGRFRCSGSVFGNQWILTAAHCMKGAFNIKVFFGYNFTNDNPSSDHQYNGEGVFIHPKYEKIPTAPLAYDIALVKLSKPIDTIGKQFVVSNICLPERWSGGDCRFKPTHNCHTREYGIVAGWGPGLYPGPINLQIGYFRLWNERYDLIEAKHPNWISMMGLDGLANQTLCGGDSGGPVFQYHLGRAVIVGVVANTKHDNMLCASWDLGIIGGAVPQVRATWVDQEIDWIKDVIKNATTNKP